MLLALPPLVERESGFTLLEIMIVGVIITIMAALAIGQLDSSVPRYRLQAEASNARMTILEARGRAMRVNRMQKICFFADDDTSDRAAKGRILRLECGGSGVGCNTGTVCTDEAAYASSGVTSGDVVPLTGIPGDCTTEGKWCVLADGDYDFTAGDRATEHVSVFRFKSCAAALPSSCATLNRKSLELTFGTGGYLLPDRSTTTAGYVQLVNRDECRDLASCTAANGAGFAEVSDVQFSLGGAARLTGGL